MPVRKVAGGYKWWSHGEVYKSKAKAERQGGLSMPADTEKNKPELNVEALWSIFKCMFGLLVFTNLLWVGLFAYYVHKSIIDVSPSIEMTQDGQDNNQSLTNG